MDAHRKPTGNKMKVGSLVRALNTGDDWHYRCGVVIGLVGGDPIVYWGTDYPEEREYEHQLKVVG